MSRVGGAARVAGQVVVVTAVAGAAFWGGRVTMTPPVQPQDMVSGPVVVRSTLGEVGRQLTVSTTVRVAQTPVSTNALTGVVTETSPKKDFADGDVLFVVDDVPVVAVQAARPFYRALAEGASGWDVAQLRAFLVRHKYLTTTDDRFTAAVTDAVKQWQRDLKVAATGQVAASSLVAIPVLPASLAFDAKLIPGMALAGGEQLVLAPTGRPSFELVVNDSQARQIPQGAVITIPHRGKDYSGVVSGAVPSEDGQQHLAITAADGTAVCGKDCPAFAADGSQSILSTVTIVKPVSGTLVPAAAVVTRADGTAHVTLAAPAAGQRDVVVTILGSQDGMVAVSGLAPDVDVVVSGPVDQPVATDPSPSSLPSR